MECGYSYTSKIEGMFNDMRVSREVMSKFEKHKAFKLKNEKIDFYVHLLTAAFWPAYTLSNAVLVDDMQTCTKAYLTYYNETHSGRKITWQASLGGGIVTGKFPLGKYEIMVSTYQMIILMLMNNNKKMKYTEILEKTKIPEKDLKRNLLSLCAGKYKLIVKYPESNTVLYMF